LTVYDLRDPTRPRRIAHYAAPDERFFALAPLPDNRILMGGRQLHIVRGPEGR
jgi:hypothetical protein